MLNNTHDAHTSVDRLVGCATVEVSAPRLQRSGRSIHVRLPRTLTRGALIDVADRFWNIADQRFLPAHIIAIGESGLALGAVISTHERAVDLKSFTSISDAFDFKAEDLTVSSGCVVLVDNSVQTGTTARRALRALTAQGIQVDVLVKLFDYEDALETATSNSLMVEFGVLTFSLYSVSSLHRQLKH